MRYPLIFFAARIGGFNDFYFHHIVIMKVIVKFVLLIMKVISDVYQFVRCKYCNVLTKLNTSRMYYHCYTK